jgi:hypothetical protein
MVAAPVPDCEQRVAGAGNYAQEDGKLNPCGSGCHSGVLPSVCIMLCW